MESKFTELLFCCFGKVNNLLFWESKQFVVSCQETICCFGKVNNLFCCFGKVNNLLFWESKQFVVSCQETICCFGKVNNLLFLVKKLKFVVSCQEIKIPSFSQQNSVQKKFLTFSLVIHVLLFVCFLTELDKQPITKRMKKETNRTINSRKDWFIFWEPVCWWFLAVLEEEHF